VRATSGEGVAALFALQKAMMEKDADQYRLAVEMAEECGDEGVVEAAGWTEEGGASLAHEALAGDVDSR
jgi:hypothetical protein